MPLRIISFTRRVEPRHETADTAFGRCEATVDIGGLQEMPYVTAGKRFGLRFSSSVGAGHEDELGKKRHSLLTQAELLKMSPGTNVAAIAASLIKASRCRARAPRLSRGAATDLSHGRKPVGRCRFEWSPVGAKESQEI